MPSDSVVHVIDDDEAVRRFAGVPAADARGSSVKVYDSAAAFLARGRRRGPAASSPMCACRK